MTLENVRNTKLTARSKKKRKKIKINFGIDIFSYIYVGAFFRIVWWRKSDMELYLNKLMRESHLKTSFGI